MADIDVPADPRIPVNVLTGFLGSGKTTLLRRLLASADLAHTAVVVNELGEIGIDHHLIDQVDEEVVLLRNGCLCCGVRGDLSTALTGLMERDRRAGASGTAPGIRRVVIETTGLADPVPVLNTLALDPMLRHQFRPGAVVTTVDAVHGMLQLREHPESVRQAAVADRIVMTKTDLASAAAVEALAHELRGLNSAAPLLMSNGDLDPARLLLDRDVFSVDRLNEVRAWFAPPREGPGVGQYHGMARTSPALGPFHSAVSTASLVYAPALDWVVAGAWLSMLVHRYGDTLLRLKGILNIAGSDRPTVVHGVRHLIHAPMHLDAWPDDDRRSRLVLIGTLPSQAALQASLERFARQGRAADAGPGHQPV
ncbi:hypothetical protein CAL26_01625 [Bordetella genomosp. 9]|uniref:CobW C-terminal domain-containing protein n=1 Tax=Bordetella genomosp. 9 TaxID=1416803 RepID=A0A261RM39_9BORD|nr:GTP-binding protein [Bordetella genomosp. 9]OZI26079.1 hypothetical protein CAL26_01625 [Bordetella genomosp. 9]